MQASQVHLVGSWRTEVGDCDTFVHIWEYQRYAGYHQSLNAIQNHPEFPEFDRKLKKLIRSKRTSLMQEFSFWPTTSPRKLGGVFELRTYTLHPGNLLEWEHHWRKGLEARKEVMEGVGACKFRPQCVVSYNAITDMGCSQGLCKSALSTRSTTSGNFPILRSAGPGVSRAGACLGTP